MKTRDKILELLGAGQLNQIQLAKKLEKTEATISYHIKKLIKEGRITASRSTSKFINLNSKFDSNLEQISTRSPAIDTTSPSQADSSPRLRLHRMIRSYEIKEQNQNSLSNSKTIKLNNNNQQIVKYKGLTLRITTKHMMIEGFEAYSDLQVPMADVVARAEAYLDAIAEAAGHELGIGLVGDEVNDVMRR